MPQIELGSAELAIAGRAPTCQGDCMMDSHADRVVLRVQVRVLIERDVKGCGRVTVLQFSWQNNSCILTSVWKNL